MNALPPSCGACGSTAPSLTALPCGCCHACPSLEAPSYNDSLGEACEREAASPCAAQLLREMFPLTCSCRATCSLMAAATIVDCQSCSRRLCLEHAVVCRRCDRALCGACRESRTCFSCHSDLCECCVSSAPSKHTKLECHLRNCMECGPTRLLGRCLRVRCGSCARPVVGGGTCKSCLRQVRARVEQRLPASLSEFVLAYLTPKAPVAGRPRKRLRRAH